MKWYITFFALIAFGFFQNLPAFSQDVVYEEVEEMPEFVGGENTMYQYIASNIVYPYLARERNISGTVYVSFIIEKDGSISNVSILKGIGGGCDEEAIRVVKNMPKWIPGKEKRNPVRVRYNLPIKFFLY